MLLLKYLEGWNYRELAAYLDVTPCAVEARLHRARARLRGELAADRVIEENRMMTTDDALQLDRLVDGELSAEARRAFFARLDASPEGWKRCALAFLEAQAWRESFVEAAREAPASATTAVVRPVRPRVAPWMARAAVVLAASALGWAAPPAPTGGRADRPRPQARRPSRTGPGPAEARRRPGAARPAAPPATSRAGWSARDTASSRRTTSSRPPPGTAVA